MKITDEVKKVIAYDENDNEVVFVRVPSAKPLPNCEKCKHFDDYWKQPGCETAYCLDRKHPEMTLEETMSGLIYLHDSLIDERGSDFSGVKAIKMAIRSVEAWLVWAEWFRRTEPCDGPDGSKDRGRYYQWICDYHGIKRLLQFKGLEE